MKRSILANPRVGCAARNRVRDNVGRCSGLAVSTRTDALPRLGNVDAGVSSGGGYRAVGIVFGLSIGLVSACGGSSEPAPNTGGLEENGVRETEGEVETEAVADPIPEETAPPPARPASATVVVRLAGEDITTNVLLVDVNGETAWEGRSGETFTITEGSYMATIEVGDEVIGGASHQEEVYVEAGDTQELRITVPVARVVLNVRRRGRALRNPQVALFRAGSEEEVASFRAGSRPIKIAPGRYEAEVRLSGQNIRVRGLTFMDGAQQTIPVDIQ
ncbi:MAG: hypothetical protein AAGF12_16695 [Myxococcota bacterium]